ncbi:MAG: HAD-IC family P-type ATPase, partial [Patescibacteria group bacterium]
MTEGNWPALTVLAALKSFGSSLAGLTAAEVAKRQQTYGQNVLTPPPPPSAWQIYLSQFKNTLIIILLAAALLTAAVWLYNHEGADLVEAGLILAIVVMITLFGFFQEFKAERALAKIKSLLSYQATVIRGGAKQVVLTAELVPGDIVVLEEGSRIPADVRLVEVVDLDVNEAVLTGESQPVRKTAEPITGQLPLAERKNLAYSGTTVVGGRATALVIATGNQTEIGKIAGLVSETNDGPTPIQRRLDEIGRTIGLSVTVIAVILFFYAFFFAPAHADLLVERLLAAAIAAVALAVAAVPEGLPAVVTIAMANGSQKMLKRNVLVRKLNSVETLGSVDVICSDKTGTLT